MREGQRVGDYTLVARIGAGGMGETWLAARPGLDKKVVLKMILPELAAIPQASQYFSAESKLGARLHHSNIVNLVDRGSGYIVLEYVEGIDLERLLGAHRNLSPEWAVFIASQLCKALSYVHNARIDGQPGEIVHRDVTPDNVFLTCAAEVKLGDFGIAQVKAALRERTAIPGQIKGKYRYLSPEMARGELVDHRADIFQVGLILYEMVTGTAAFTGTRAGTENIKRGSYRPIQDLVSDVPAPLVEVIERLMANEPDGRPASAALAGELVEDACPTFYRAGRSLSEAVMKLADLRASTTFNVPDHLRSMLAQTLATGAPQPSPSTVIVQSTPDAKTLPGDEPAQNATPLLPAEPGGIMADTARERAAPVAAVDSSLTVPLRPPIQVATPWKAAPARRGKLVPVLFLAAVLVVVFLAFRPSRRRTEVASAAPPVRLATPVPAPPEPPAAPIPPSVSSPIPMAPPAEPAAARQAVARADKPAPHSDEPNETGDEQVGMIEVRRESQPMRILIDGASFVAPVHYKAEPGPHEVELVRGTAPNEQHAKVTLKVRAGHRYAVNGPHALGGMAAPAGVTAGAVVAPPAAPSAAPTFGQTYADAQSTYIKNACPAAQTLAHQAMKLAGDAKQHRDAALLFSSAACCAHDAHAVADAWPQLDDNGRGFIVYLCKRSGTQAPTP